MDGGAQPTLLLAKNVSQVWGKKVEPPPAPPAAAAPSAAAPVAVSAVASPAAGAPYSTPVSSEAHKTASPAAVSNVPAAPREPTEKEKMAAALFGGVGAGSSKAAAPVRRTSQSQQSNVYSAPAAPATVIAVHNPAPPQATASVNLLDMLGDVAPAAHVPAPAAVAKPVSAPAPHTVSAMDLLADLDMPTVSAQPAVAVPKAAPAPSAFDVFDSLISPTPSGPALAAAAVHPPVSSAAGISAMGGGAPLPSGFLGAAPSVSTLKPLTLTTNEFGMRWGHTPAEMKHSTPCKVKTLAALRAALEGTLQIGHVESIAQTNESIYAASLASCPGGLAPLGSLVLVHIKLNAVRMDCSVTVKSSSKDLCAELVKVLCETISQTSL